MRYVKIAEKLAYHSKHPKARLGAVIIGKAGKILGLGFNSLKTHSKSRHPYKTLHAEMSAIINCRSDLKGCSIYIVRIKRDGSYGESKPCPFCQLMIEEAGIKNIHYYDGEKGLVNAIF